MTDINDLLKVMDDRAPADRIDIHYSITKLQKRVATAVKQNSARTHIGTKALSTDLALQMAADDEPAAAAPATAACPLCACDATLVTCPNAECLGGSACADCYEQWRAAQGGGAVTCIGQVGGRKCGVHMAKVTLQLAGYSASKLRLIEREVVERAVAARDGDTVALLLPIVQKLEAAADDYVAKLTAFKADMSAATARGRVSEKRDRELLAKWERVVEASDVWDALSNVVQNRPLNDIRDHGTDDTDDEWERDGPARKANRMACCPRAGCAGAFSVYAEATTSSPCTACGAAVCLACHSELGADGKHACANGATASVRTMLKNTQSCPGCFAAIQKTDGCDQMFCTQCQRPFSYTTGVEITTGFHNPHFAGLPAALRAAITRRNAGRQPGAGAADGGLACAAIDSLVMQNAFNDIVGTVSVFNTERRAALENMFWYAVHLAETNRDTLESLADEFERSCRERRIARLRGNFRRLPHLTGCVPVEWWEQMRSFVRRHNIDVVHCEHGRNSRAVLRPEDELKEAIKAYRVFEQRSQKVLLRQAYCTCVTELLRLAASAMAAGDGDALQPIFRAMESQWFLMRTGIDICEAAAFADVAAERRSAMETHRAMQRARTLGAAAATPPVWHAGYAAVQEHTAAAAAEGAVVVDLVDWSGAIDGFDDADDGWPYAFA